MDVYIERVKSENATVVERRGADNYSKKAGK